MKKFFNSVIIISFLLLSCGNSGNEQDPSYSSSDTNLSSSSSELQSSSSENDLSSSSSGGLPVMDSRVVSHQKVNRDFVGFREFVTDKEVLKECFPHIFNNEDANCDYFALSFSTSSLSVHYVILSQDINLYIIKASKGSCAATEDIIAEMLLVCDDEIGTVRNSIDLDSVSDYYDPNWNCDEEGWVGTGGRDVFF